MDFDRKPPACLPWLIGAAAFAAIAASLALLSGWHIPTADIWIDDEVTYYEIGWRRFIVVTLSGLLVVAAVVGWFRSRKQ